MIFNNRQSGRTTRIANFAVDQLFSVGHVIITDHTAFEFTKPTYKMVKHLEDVIRRDIKIKGHGKKKVRVKRAKFEGKPLLYITMK